MATALQMEGRMLENLKKQLALAVRNIQWSYGIFWSISARQPGVLEWGDGYYNGDIKTRKTTQSIELNADQLGLQRSEQLRELYESLSIGEANPQSRRPSVALSPEDLSDPEWYYLVCMSFVFNIGQGLPGRTLANGQPTWLCNAHFADSKVFSRSLLAKSASIQTVICFPFLGGVIELGVTEPVPEDPSLIQHVKTSFLEIPYSTIISKKSMMVAGSTRIDNNPACTVLDQDILQNKLIAYVGSAELGINVSPNNSSNGFEPSQPAEGSFMVEGINGGVSQVQSWQFMDDEFSNCVLHSMNSSDCISQTFVEPEKAISTPKGEMAKQPCLQDLQECNHTKMNSLDFRSDDLHYQGVLSSLLKSSHQSILGPCFKNYHHESSFALWNKGDLENFQRGGTPQMILKKVLIAVPQMHAVGLPESPEDICKRDEVWRPEADEIGANSALAERRRREKLNERFLILRSMVPSISKGDKVSILDDAIEYVKELERRVEELGSCRELAEVEARTKRKSQDTVERISDNYGDSNVSNSKRPLINKRKACDIDETSNYNVSKESSTDNVTVSMINKEVLIEMRCPWKEGVLLEIMDAVSNLQLDCHSVQSSASEGILSLTIKSKFKGSVVVSSGIIKQELQRLTRKF
ncbi:hypothetical protein I3760_12G089900 [Carya illinoinensis]|nr:hypothetical protein I3760_12G089900 [Carya illinoinensis]KAG2677242.1 hypothetical protein I3760_12G089900 [Carya illinoinensis]KAG2677245.1 hypothetical protein I3760_12G089900 [Carya illinoinensis]KAG2677246.1 hypothetical protein I3760_12G089900 [Carya illinoinensis]KAG2677247.1 hypothetical protein I3760_12G089900 [Carya illinoinensis]